MVCLYFQERDPSETEEVLIFFSVKTLFSGLFLLTDDDSKEKAGL